MTSRKHRILLLAVFLLAATAVLMAAYVRHELAFPEIHEASNVSLICLTCCLSALVTACLALPAKALAGLLSGYRLHKMHWGFLLAERHGDRIHLRCTRRWGGTLEMHPPRQDGTSPVFAYLMATPLLTLLISLAALALLPLAPEEAVPYLLLVLCGQMCALTAALYPAPNGKDALSVLVRLGRSKALKRDWERSLTQPEEASSAPPRPRDVLFDCNSFATDAYARFSLRMSALPVRDGRILLQCPVGTGDYAFIGGHTALGETAEQTLVREIREELHCGASVGRLAAVGEVFIDWGRGPQGQPRHCHQVGLYFLVDLNTDELPPGDCFTGYDEWGGERVDLAYHWVPLDQLSGITVYPPQVVDHLLSGSSEVLHFTYSELPPDTHWPE